MTLWLDDGDVRLYHGDALYVLRGLEDSAADAVVTSPPYLDARSEYPSPTIAEFEAIFLELRRVCSGPALINVGRIFREGRELRWWVELAEAAERSGWAHLDTIVWVKPNANPIHGAVLANRHEYVLILGSTADELNVDAVRVPYAESSIARLRRGWTNHTGVKGDKRAPGTRLSEPHPIGGRPPSYLVADVGREKGNPHPAPMPLDLAVDLVSLASSPSQTVLDPFVGSGTTLAACRRLGRSAIGIDLSLEYLAIAADRLSQLSLLGGSTEHATTTACVSLQATEEHMCPSASSTPAAPS